jgi:hypothetical protein
MIDRSINKCHDNDDDDDDDDDGCDGDDHGVNAKRFKGGEDRMRRRK